MPYVEAGAESFGHCTVQVLEPNMGRSLAMTVPAVHYATACMLERIPASRCFTPGARH